MNLPILCFSGPNACFNFWPIEGVALSKVLPRLLQVPYGLFELGKIGVFGVDHVDFRNSDFAVANPDSSFTEFITIESMETLLVWYFWLVLESLRLFLEKSLDKVLDFDMIEKFEPRELRLLFDSTDDSRLNLDGGSHSPPLDFSRLKKDFSGENCLEKNPPLFLEPPL